MFSKSRRSSSNRRSRNNRFSNNFSIESLERREMFAANLAADIGSLLASNPNIDSQPAAVASLTTSITAAPVAGSGHFANDELPNRLDSAIAESLPVNLSVLGATFADGVLTVTGTNGADHINIYASEGTVYVREVVKELSLLAVPAAQLTGIVVHAHGGDDWVNVDHQTINVPATLNGGSGNDMLQGGAGNDNLSGGSGNDELMGYAGNDVLTAGDGADLLVGGDGDDNITCNAGDDYVLGGDGNDWLYGEDGNDVLFGEAGDDFQFGGAGQNLLDGGTGNDALYGGNDADDIYGGDGDDFIMGLAGNDRIRGENGDDNIFGGEGADIIDGGDGNDVVRGEDGNDAISGGTGNDFIYGGAGHDWLNGGAGHDSINGEAGNDWLEGASGTDLLSGGAGTNKIYQDHAPGAQPTGQIASASTLGDLGDALEDGWESLEEAGGQVGDVLVDVAEWTLDTAVTVGGLYYNWAVNLDDRILRLGDDLATTLSNWPWEPEFWDGMGRVLIDCLEIVGIGEAWQLYFTYYMPWQRSMTDAEIDVARSVFGSSINFHLVRMNEHSLMNVLGSVISGQDVEAHAIGYIINSNGNVSDATMIHELTHVWQYEEDGLIYIPEAYGAQQGEGYEYGGVADLQDTIDAGGGLSAYNREQQGDIVMDYFTHREELLSTNATGATLADMHSDLDVYIYFVKAVSTLSGQELDVPQSLASAGSDGRLLAAASNTVVRPSAEPVTSPIRGDANQAALLAVDSVFDQLSQTPKWMTTVASNLLDTLPSGPTAGNIQTTSSLVSQPADTSKNDASKQTMGKSMGKLVTSPINTRTLDLAFASRS